MDDLVIGMAGSGGDGIVSAGESLIAAAAYEGYHALMTKSFGSQVRGGESSCRVRLSTHRVHNPGGALDVAVALNWEDFLKFGSELPVSGDTVVIYEKKTGVAPEAIPLVGVSPKQVFAVPIGELAKQGAGSDKAKNTVVLGLVSGWFGIPREAILRGLAKKFAKKGPELVAANEKAFAGGALARPFARLYGEYYEFHFGMTSALAAGLALGGFALAYAVYGRGRRAAPALVVLVERVADTRAVNRLYEAGFRSATLPLAAALAWTDRYVVDGLINMSAWATLETGRSARRIQTGYAPDYVLAVLVGVVGVTAWALLQ